MLYKIIRAYSIQWGHGNVFWSTIFSKKEAFCFFLSAKQVIFDYFKIFFLKLRALDCLRLSWLSLQKSTIGPDCTWKRSCSIMLKIKGLAINQGSRLRQWLELHLVLVLMMEDINGAFFNKVAGLAGKRMCYSLF